MGNLQKKKVILPAKTHYFLKKYRTKRTKQSEMGLTFS